MLRPKNNGENFVLDTLIAVELLRLTPALNTWREKWYLIEPQL